MSTTYIITAEALKEATYQQLHKAVMKFGTWARITKSSWVVVSDKKPTVIRDELTLLLGPTDRLFVVRSGTAAAWRNVRCKNEWLKEHL